jgi:hypothetical protein
MSVLGNKNVTEMLEQEFKPQTFKSYLTEVDFEKLSLPQNKTMYHRSFTLEVWGMESVFHNSG